MSRPTITIALAGLLTLVALGATTSQAATLSVNDGAGFFSPEAIQTAQTKVGEARQPVTVLIETFTTPPTKMEVPGKDQAAARHEFWLNLAQKKAKEAGSPDMYIFISRDPGHLQIEWKKKLGWTDPQVNTLRDTMLTRFKNKDYDEALTVAAGYLQSELNKPAAQTNRNVRAPAPAQGGQTNWLLWAGVAVVGVVVIMLISSLLRGLGGGGMGGGGMGGGGGLFGGLMAGLVGAMAGSWLYDSFFSNHANAGPMDPGSTDMGGGDDYNSSSGGDWGDSGGGDFGGGDDMGGGDF